MPFCQSCGASLANAGSPCAACGPQAVPFTPASGTSAGLSPQAAGALAYLAGLVTGVIFLVVEPFKQDRFVRFHAFQSIFFNVAWVALWIAWLIVGLVLGAVTKGLFFILQIPINLLLMVGGFCLWALLMYNAYQGKMMRLPVIGALAAKQAGL
jgi:uncharacterized membrane protein